MFHTLKFLRHLFSQIVVFLPIAIVLLFWHQITIDSPQRRFFYSSPSMVLGDLRAGLADGSLMRHTGVTAGTAFVGFALGNIAGLICGMALWYSPFVARVSQPYLTVMGAFPVFSIAPMTILWWGTGITAKVMLAFIATFVLAAGQAYHGVAQTDSNLVARFRILGASRWATFRHLLLPGAMVWIARSLRLSIGASLLGVYVGELISSTSGLAHMIVRASGVYDTSRVIVGVVCFVVLALAFDAGVSWFVRRYVLIDALSPREPNGK